MKFLAGVVLTLLIGLAVCGFVLGTGRFNVAATAPPDFTDKLAPWVLDKSIERRARDITDAVARDPGAVGRGMSHYRENCLPCHGAPGVDAAEFPEGMNPTPPDIDSPTLQHATDAELFWVIKNGIRMTGMPAFGVNHKDEEIRDIVAFVRHATQITDAERQALKTGAGLEEHHHGEAGEDHLHGAETPAASPSPAASAAGSPSASPSPHTHKHPH
jgi:mono/diheme cytochrome c family protein